MARGRPDDDDYDDVDEDAPWLAEGVRDRTASATVVRRGRLVGGVLLFAALLALVVIGIYVIAAKKQDGGSGYARAEDAPLIAADPGPYKVAPTDPGGMAVAGADSTIYAAGGGQDPGSSLDLGALPEEPMARPGPAAPAAAPAEQPAGKPVDLMPPLAKAATMTPIAPAPVRIETAKIEPPKAEKPVPPKPKEQVALATPAPTPAPTGIRIESTRVTTPKPKDDSAPPLPKPMPGPASLQLGAFSTSAKADAAWTAASGRYSYLAGLSKRVDKVERDGATLYRLRAAGVASKSAAADLCARLKIAGEACIVAE